MKTKKSSRYQHSVLVNDDIEKKIIILRERGYSLTKIIIAGIEKLLKN